MKGTAVHSPKIVNTEVTLTIAGLLAIVASHQLTPALHCMQHTVTVHKHCLETIASRDLYIVSGALQLYDIK